MSNIAQKNIVVGFGAIITALAFSTGLHFDNSYAVGALGAGLYLLHCH